MSKKELMEIIVEIYLKTLQQQSRMLNRAKYFEELISLNKKYEIDYSEASETVKESNAKYEILDAVLNDIHNTLADYNTDIENLKKELDN